MSPIKWQVSVNVDSVGVSDAVEVKLLSEGDSGSSDNAAQESSKKPGTLREIMEDPFIWFVFKVI